MRTYLIFMLARTGATYFVLYFSLIQVRETRARYGFTLVQVRQSRARRVLVLVQVREMRTPPCLCARSSEEIARSKQPTRPIQKSRPPKVTCSINYYFQRLKFVKCLLQYGLSKLVICTPLELA